MQKESLSVLRSLRSFVAKIVIFDREDVSKQSLSPRCERCVAA